MLVLQTRYEQEQHTHKKKKKEKEKGNARLDFMELNTTKKKFRVYHTRAE